MMASCQAAFGSPPLIGSANIGRSGSSNQSRISARSAAGTSVAVGSIVTPNVPNQAGSWSINLTDLRFFFGTTSR